MKILLPFLVWQLFASTLHIKFVKGKVFLREGKIQREIVDLKKINWDKKLMITTMDKSMAVVMVEHEGSRSTVKINPNSMMKFHPKDKVVKLDGGSSIFQMVKSKLKKGKIPLKIMARRTSFAVRGTRFFVGLASPKRDDIWMCVNEGKVEVSTIKNKVLVKEGEGVFIADSKDVGDAKAYPWTKKLNWNLDPKKGELNNKVNLQKVYSDPRELHYD